tara:strand:+ start:18987 stop:22895 length:3909 start_codon:yes stop_codon:yes gene_type:complete
MSSGKQYLTGQKYFKPNYYEALKFIIPQYLTEDDIENFGQEVDLRDQVLNSNIKLAENFHTLIEVSSVAHTVFSSIDTLAGISNYFVKQNNLTNVTSRSFQDKILSPLGVSIQDYGSSSEFSNYISGTLLPSITLNNASPPTFVAGHSPSDTHNYLIENLSWLYFLNTSGPNEAYNPSTTVTEQIVEKLYTGQPIQTVDGIKMLMDFVWRDGHTAYYPEVFKVSSTTFTSGTQQLDNLKTWIDVIYSPLQSDFADFTVRDRFATFIENSILINNKIPNGPFTKFLRALSFIAQDINDTSERLGSLYDISECPEEFLPLLAELIGWDLFGSDPERWRLQLRNAVDIYKAVGTKKSLQLAINSILPKDQFSIETSVTELNESYVPYLIYYSLATESKHFKSFDDWTEPLANEMQVSGYSTTSLDENLKLTVDRILLETYEKFKDKFGQIPNQEKGFRYRGRVYPIPPFEEYSYYMNFELNREIIEFIKDRLVCFGVSQTFANQFESYLVEYALDDDDAPRTSSFLVFTPDYNDPPNLSNLVASGYNEKFEYVSLWSGKSSHFRIKYDASSFDFDNEDIGTSGAGGAFLVASKLAKDFTPAHAIPLINLEISYIDPLSGTFASALPLIHPRCEEQESRNSKNHFVSGIGFDTYMRDVRPDGKLFGRNYLDNVDSAQVLAGTSLDAIPRTSIRRRNYEKLLPKDGYYDRTGFNMPISFTMASSVSGLPLGLNPSSYVYTPVTDHVNLPPIWNQCEGYNSANSYYTYDVSNTLNARGSSTAFPTNQDLTVDRCQLPDIYATMHSVKEKSKVLQASATFGPATEYQLSVSNVYQSYANSSTENQGDFPNSVEDYHNYSFGRDLHKLYKIYVTDYVQHQMIERLQYVDGANIFSHAFGPVLLNHDFEDVSSTSSVITSSLSATRTLTPRSSVFNGEQSYVASTANDMFLDTSEKVLSGAIDYVELIHTSGSPETNSFSIFRIPTSFKKSTDDPYMFDNTFVLSRSSEGGLPRVRFDLKKYKAPSDRPIDTNFLLPEHTHQARINLLVSDNNGLNFGGRQVGIWIHTKPEGGKMWSYDAKGNWTQHSALTTRSNVVNKFAHVFNIAEKTKEEIPSQLTRYECVDNVALNSEVSPVARLRQEDFEQISVEFNTINKNIRLPKDYRQDYTLLHRKNQKYVVEVFLLPDQDIERFMLLDSVELQNLTLKKMSEIFVTGRYQNPLNVVLGQVVSKCPEHRVELSKDDLRKILTFFNNISGKNSQTGLASRDKNKTATIMGAEGGSRLDYRYRTNFFETRLFPATTLIDQINIDV